MFEFKIIKSKSGRFTRCLDIKKTSEKLEMQKQEFLKLLSENPREGEHMSAWSARLLYNTLARKTKKYLLNMKFLEEEKSTAEDDHNIAGVYKLFKL